MSLLNFVNYQRPHYNQHNHFIMDYLSNAEIINKVSESILSPKQTSYTEDPLYILTSSLPHLAYVDAAVYNRYKQKLKVTLFYNHGQPRKHCIVFMHGFGSNRLEALNILTQLPPYLDLCCFDFSGEGKSQGKIVTYGKKQKDDIRAVLGYLRNCKFQKFILWGRSMGASTALFFSIKEQPEDVLLQILDSPYSSFAEIAFQLSKKRINLPDILLNMGIQAIRNKFQKNNKFNPFDVNFNHRIDCPIPTIFIYSENDDVVNHRNTLAIIEQFRGHYQKIIINENHNAIRTVQSVKKIIDLINKYMGQHKLKKPRSVPKWSKSEITKQKTQTSNIFDNYGIWVSSKLGEKKNIQLSKHRGSVGSTHKEYSLKTRPKSSIKVVSADLSLHLHSQTRFQTPQNKNLSSTSLNKTICHEIKGSLKGRKRYLTNEFYL